MTTVWVEVTNTITVPFNTGFQRHTRELLRRLMADSAGDQTWVPVRWCVAANRYRRLTAAELERLHNGPPTGVPTSGRLERLPAPITTALRRLAVYRLVQTVQTRRSRARTVRHPELELNEWPDGSVWFDLEAAWHDPRHRADLLPELRRAGVRRATLVADVLPVTHPEWFDDRVRQRFVSFLRAHLEDSERFVCISQATERELRTVARRWNIPGDLDCRPTTMGADHREPERPEPLPSALESQRYALCVGTIEPRKNQALLLDAFDLLANEAPDTAVVFVGKAGWKTDALIGRMRSHPEFGRRVHWFESVSDGLLDTLYRRAFVSVTPSWSEGFGMPVIEALTRGVPTIAATTGSLPEAGGQWAEYVDPDRPDQLAQRWRAHLHDPGHHDAARQRLTDYRAPTWEQGADLLRAAIADW